MRKTSNRIRSFAAAVLALGLSGCTVMHTTVPIAQSHFSYPNSNVSPIGHAVGTATSGGLVPVMMDPDLEEKAIAQAIASKGGDMLVDYKMSTKVTMIPLMFIMIYTTTVKVEGTVAKMTIGKQKLY